MLRNVKHLVPLTGALVLALTAPALLAGSGEAQSGPVRCDVLATSDGGMVTLEGVVHAEMPTSGSYVFRVRSVGGSSDTSINQGGDFSAGPGQPARVGEVTLGGSGAIFDATLDVETPEGRLSCSERAGVL